METAVEDKIRRHVIAVLNDAEVRVQLSVCLSVCLSVYLFVHVQCTCTYI